MRKIFRFKDEWLKLNWYKEKIERELIEKQIYGETAKERIENIDLMLSLYRHQSAMQDTSFDAELLNEHMERIYQDLKFLLYLLKREVIKEFYNIKAFSEIHLKELEDYAEHYKKRYEAERVYGYLGETILYKGRNFPILPIENNGTRIPLGEIEVNAGNKLIGAAKINNILSRFVRFVFTDKETNKQHFISHYQHIRDQFLVPGNITREKYAFEKDESHPFNQPVIFKTEGLDPNPKHRHVVLEGKGHVLSQSSFRNSIIKLNTEKAFVTENKSKISFWISGGSYIRFNLSKKPEKDNLDNKYYHEIKGLKYFYMEVEEKTAIKIDTDGEIYAGSVVPKIKESYFSFNPTNSTCDEFILIINKGGEKKKYDVAMEIQDHSIISKDIDYIIIKKQ